MAYEFRCHACDAPQTLREKPMRTDECSACFVDVRCCANCRHYDPSASNGCRETVADYVHKKDRTNFCEFFDLQPLRAAQEEEDDAAAARAKLEALFNF